MYWIILIAAIASIVLSSISLGNKEKFSNDVFLDPEKYFKENVNEDYFEFCTNYFEGKHVNLPKLQSTNPNLEVNKPSYEPDDLPPICKKLIRKVYKKDYDFYRNILKIK